MARRLRHGMSVACHCSRWRRRCSNSSGNAESSATTLSGRPRWAIAAPMTSLLPTWPAVTMIPPLGVSSRMRWSSAGSSGSMSAMTWSSGMNGTRISSTR